jgi:D-beta-D-heptose 7-phosphate kinase/D-beta-D-heptose 1-phosphate adenosyltransferase
VSRGRGELLVGLERLAEARVVVLGDVMVDEYVDGGATRISPEAPVPVVRVDEEFQRPGGAANVARNVQVLGGSAALIGLIGDDAAGRSLREMLSAQGVDASDLIIDRARPTTRKTRIRARGQQIARVDREATELVGEPLEDALVGAVERRLEQADALVIEDYDKGVLSPRVIARATAAAIERGVPVAVDPKIRAFRNYRNVSLFKPNRYEAEIALGMTIDSDDAAVRAAERLRRELNCEAVLLTRGAAGMTLLQSADSKPRHVRATACEVFDVSGAGDTVIATMAMALASQVSLRTATTLAGLAAGIEVERVGVAAVTRAEVRAALLRNERRS